jgi:hypothetical protein
MRKHGQNMLLGIHSEHGHVSYASYVYVVFMYFRGCFHAWLFILLLSLGKTKEQLHMRNDSGLTSKCRDIDARNLPNTQPKNRTPQVLAEVCREVGRPGCSEDSDSKLHEFPKIGQGNPAKAGSPCRPSWCQAQLLFSCNVWNFHQPVIFKHVSSFYAVSRVMAWGC